MEELYKCKCILLLQNNYYSVNNTSIMVEAIPFDVIAYPNPSNYQFTLVCRRRRYDKVETWF
jgi:hypothetical protein